MATAKEQRAEILAQQPDNSSCDELVRALALITYCQMTDRLGHQIH